VTCGIVARVIVVLDSTALVSDPLLRRVPWKTLAHWGVRLCITDVVLQEAIAGYNRRLDKAVVGFEKWAARHAGSLGIQSLAAGGRRQLSERRASYAKQLRSALNETPIEVLPIPNVEHHVLVQRATRRVKPCDKDGNGYRDTLNWFSLLALAEEGDTSVIWVSDDSDFADEGEAVLHPELQAELIERDLQGRIMLIQSVQDVALAVARQLGNAGEDLRHIEARLTKDALTTYVRYDLLADLPSVEVSAASLALPLGAESPVLSALGEITDTKIDVKAALEQEEAAVEVGFTCNTTISAETSETDLGANFVKVADSDGARIWQVTKPVRFTALVTLDHDDTLTGGEIISVRALEDDSGFAPWKAPEAVDTSGDQATPWTFRRSSLREGEPELLFRTNGSIVFTSDYVTQGLLSKKTDTYGQGTEGVITRTHEGPSGEVTHLDIRLPDGEFLREVPIDHFKA
jgi:PIN domain